MRAALALLSVTALIVGALLTLEVAGHPPLLSAGASVSRRHIRRVEPPVGSSRPDVARHLPDPPTEHGPSDAVRGIQRLDEALEVLAGLVASLLLGFVALGCRHLSLRRHREYELYELFLSTHDHAKPQDLEDVVEAIANAIRAWPSERLWRGQPSLAFELICDLLGGREDGGELEWSVNVRCAPSVIVALDGALSAAYPDVRIGRSHGEAPQPRAGRLVTPRHLIRFCKERSFVYPLLAVDDLLASPPIEQIALAQISAGEPSVVRFQLTPTPLFFDALARRSYRRHERHILAARHLGATRHVAMLSTLDRSELISASRTQNRSMFWLEASVAAEQAATCRQIAAVVQARRGENRLRRIVPATGAQRRRFPRAMTPLIPSPRALVSAAEVAHLLALPSAQMKGVPVRRTTVPRIPAPPQALRATDDAPIPTPPVASSPAPASITAGR
jgi:hypothetical protein